MNTTETIIPMDAIKASTPSRLWTQKRLAIGAAALVVVATSAAAIHNTDHDSAELPAPTQHVVDERATLQDLVDRGLIPAQSLQPAPLSREDKLRDLVNRGLIPRQALDE
jgi:hypothetical protein